MFCFIDDANKYIKMKVIGDNVPPQIDTFKFDGIHFTLLSTLINKMGFINPTPIQRYSIPIVIGNRDLIACSRNGSGKTVAYLMPVINFLLHRHSYEPYRTPVAIVIAPTYELAKQVILLILFIYWTIK
jgi:superfamily II DNA/RNA helicase